MKRNFQKSVLYGEHHFIGNMGLQTDDLVLSILQRSMLGRWELSKYTPWTTTPISCGLLLLNGFPQLLSHVCVILVVFGLRLFGGKLAKIHRNTCNKISLEEGAIFEFLTQMQNLQQNKQQTWLQAWKLIIKWMSQNKPSPKINRMINCKHPAP